MSSKFLRRVEIMVWVRFLSTYNNRKIKTVLIELRIILYSSHPFFYVYSVSTHIIHVNQFTIPEPLSLRSPWFLSWVEKIQQKDCHNCFRHWTPSFNFLGNIHGNGQPHGILWEPYVYLQTPLWEGIPLTITVPPPSGPTRYEGEIRYQGNHNMC